MTIRHPIRLIIVLLLIIIPAILWLIYYWAQLYAITTLQENGENTLNLYISNLESEIEKYSFLPSILVRDNAIKEFVESPQQTHWVNKINKRLELYNTIANTAAIFLMDTSGKTIAASNWNKKNSFVGKNFAFRPYFKQAMAGEEGRYFALGKITGIRGYYFSSPVYFDGILKGAIIVKVGMHRLEKTWNDNPITILLTDTHGIIFSSTNSKWLFHTLYPLSNDIKDSVIQSGQYGKPSLEPIPTKRTKQLAPDLEILDIDIANNTEKYSSSSYLHQSSSLSKSKWIVHALSSTKPAYEKAIIITTLAGCILFIIILISIIMFQRNINLQIQLNVLGGVLS